MTLTATAAPAATSLTEAQVAMKAIEGELKAQFLERDDHAEGYVLGVMSGENVLGYGDVGTGKSDMVHSFASHVVDAKYGWWLMDRQMDKSEFLGPMDLPRYKKTGEYARNTKNTLYDSHFIFLDEAEKAGAGVKVPMLTAINEGMGKPDGEWVKLPKISAFAAINTELEKGDEAFGDRFLIKLVFERIKGADNYIALLESSVTPRVSPHPTTISLPVLKHAIDFEVPAVIVPRAIYVAMWELRCELAAAQIFPSDRRSKKSIRVLQAAAWLDGRDTVELDDLAVLRHIMWDDKDLRQKVGGIVLKHTGPVTRKAITIMQAIAEAYDELNKLVAEDESGETKAAGGARIQAKITELRGQLTSARTEAGGSIKSLMRLDEVDLELKELHVQVYVQCMNTPEAGARRMVGI